MIDFLNKFETKINDFTGLSEKTVEALNKILVVEIVNTLSTSLSYVLFGGDIYGFSNNAGSSTGVRVNVNGATHGEVKREVDNNPYIIDSILYSTTDTDNLDNNLSYFSREATGLVELETVQPLNYIEPENQYSANKNIRIVDFNGMLIDGIHAISGSIKGNTTIRLVIRLKQKIVRQNILNNDSIVENAEPSKPNRVQKIELINSDSNPKCNKYNV
jgi:hypothetical protein